MTELDARTDFYALGVLLYYLLTGKPPYTGSVAQVLRQHVEQPALDMASVRPGTDAAVTALVARLTRKKREDRPASGAEVLSLFDEALARFHGAASAATEVPPWAATRASPAGAPPSAHVTLTGRETVLPGAQGIDRIALDVSPGETAQRLRIVAIAAREVVIGRDSAVDMTLRPLPESANEAAILSMSGRHARLQLDPARGLATIEDLGSRNGTRLDGKALRAREPVPLADGALLQLGDALELRARVLAGGGSLDGVLLLRTKNTPTHAYLVLAGSVPLAGVLHLVTGAPWGFADLPVLRATGRALSIRPEERGSAGAVRWAARAVTPEVFKQALVPEIAP